jgi:hypothetical protein
VSPVTRVGLDLAKHTFQLHAVDDLLGSVEVEFAHRNGDDAVLKAKRDTP